jgi:enamine deaminase RidA (YjgF/YER057c/UK114 family)
METGIRMGKSVKHSGVLYLCGQVGDGDAVAGQRHDCLLRVDAIPAKSGSSREQILQAIVWRADMDDFAEIELGKGCLGSGRVCAGACVY